jgi:hypothetical protein
MATEIDLTLQVSGTTVIIALRAFSLYRLADLRHAAGDGARAAHAMPLGCNVACESAQDPGLRSDQAGEGSDGDRPI